VGIRKELKKAGAKVVGLAKQTLAVAIEHSMEYVHTTVENKVKELELRYPQDGIGEWKLRVARLALEEILGNEFVQRKWQFLQGLIALMVERLKGARS
jgi:hypothetical protein